MEDYLEHASSARRSPNMAFDESWYRHVYADVDKLVRSGEVRSGWAHYVTEGASKCYNPTWWFDEKWYQRRNGEVGAAVRQKSLLCGFEHFLQHGIREDYSPSIYFNTAWYRRQYWASIPINRERPPIVDYLLSRQLSRPCPTPLFDPEWYAKQYLKSVNARSTETVTALEHYMLYGRQLGYSPSAYFNELTYRKSYPDVSEQIETGLYNSGLEHYIDEGVIQGYRATSHLETAGVDYLNPEFLSTYEQSLNLNFKLISRVRQLLTILPNLN